MNCPCNKYNNTDMIKCPSCKQMQHLKCISFSSKMKNYECPECQISKMDPFFEILENILTPTILDKDSVIGEPQLSVNFAISESIKKRIKSPNDDSLHHLYILIRSLRLDNIGYEHHWPYNGSLILSNGLFHHKLNFPKNPPRAKPRKDYPIVFYFKDIEFLSNPAMFNVEYMINSKLLNEINSFDVINNYSKNDNDIYNYVISIDLVRYLKFEEILSGTKSFDSLKAMQQNYGLANSNSLEIYNERISLIDIYSGNKKINIPIRGINCLHANTYDLQNFLYSSLKNKKFNCPFCKEKSTRFYIDTKIANILKYFPHVSEITIDKNFDVIEYIESTKHIEIKLEREELFSELNDSINSTIEKNINPISCKILNEHNYNPNNRKTFEHLDEVEYVNLAINEVSKTNKIVNYTKNIFNKNENIENINIELSNLIQLKGLTEYNEITQLFNL